LTVVLVGWALGLPFAVWAWRDIRRIDPTRWAGVSVAEAWLAGLVAGYVLGGWPAIVVAIAWRTSMTRDSLVAFRARPAPPDDAEPESEDGSAVEV
jgi:hypothetical protein